MAKKKSKWTLETCKVEALKYSTRWEWAKKNGYSYSIACHEKWLEECTAHMVKKTKNKIEPKYKKHKMPKWTLEKCIAQASKYSSKAKWRKGSYGSYQYANLKKWMAECALHMKIEKVNSNRKWTPGLCKAEALKYSRSSEWEKNSKASYLAASSYGWLKECRTHMVEKQVQWLLDECKEAGLSYNTNEEWKEKDINTYSTASKNNWMEHIEYLRNKQNGI